jgi:hypothetical protein
MILTIVCAILCFAAAIIMLAPYFRKITLLRPMAFFLIFEGAYQIVSYVIADLYPTSTIPDTVHRVGISLIILYYIFIMIMTRTKSRRKKREKK